MRMLLAGDTRHYQQAFRAAGEDAERWLDQEGGMRELDLLADDPDPDSGVSS
jgi:hypothetical protein